MARPMHQPSLPALTVTFLFLVAACDRPNMAAAEPVAGPAPTGLSVRVEAGIDVGDLGRFQSLFVTGQRAGSGGPPQLLRQVPAAGLPATVELTVADLTVPGSLRGDWLIEARLDQDGHVPVSAGDFAGSASVSLGADGGQVTIKLDQRLDTGDVIVDVEPRFRGTLELDPSFAGLNGTRTLFLSIKQSPGARGMPRAAMRIDGATFPLRFDIGPEHVPLQVENKNDMLTGELWFVARLDGDGNAMSQAEGDLSCEPLAVVAGGDPFTATLNIPYSP